jgi:hypothetical protein
MNEFNSAGSPQRRRFTEEFKRDAVRLIVEEQYTFKAAATAVGVSEQSLRHCELQYLNDTLWVFDLNSKNGTLVNGARVLESPLVLGDTLQVGCWLFVLVDDSAQLQSSQETIEDLGALNQVATGVESRSRASCTPAG